MHYILCYGDSNTWGCIPGTVERFAHNIRWPGVLSQTLGSGYHVYENALNGRTTVFQDPIEEGRCGKEGLPTLLEACMPLDMVVIMLGTNDCKNRFSLDAWDIGWGMDLLIQYVKRSHCGQEDGVPQILILSPPQMGDAWEQTVLGTVFGRKAAARAQQLPEIYAGIARRNNVQFMEAGLYTKVGCDCIHMDADSHLQLGVAIAEKVRAMLMA